MRPRLLVLSMDAMVGEDLEYLKTKPHFSRLFGHCARVEQVRTVYPSITYPAHVSILTGCLPGRHGVITNGSFQLTDGPTRWHTHASAVRTEDLFAAAKRAGCSTAAVYWPVTGCNPNVDYLIDEYFFPDPEETVEEGFARLGADENTLRVVRENAGRLPAAYHDREGKLTKANTYDDFIMGCVCGLIRAYRPEVLLAHNCMLDTLRHRYGVFHEFVQEGLDMTDQWLGEVLSALEDAGVLEETNFVLLSDHGQMNYARKLSVNRLLARDGFLSLDGSGNVTSWQAFSQSNGMSATVFLSDPEDRSLRQRVFEDLQRRCEESVWGIGRVYPEEECREKYGMYGGFGFLLETDGITAFSDSCRGPLIAPADRTGPLGATHGYQPEKGPQPVFAASGPAFRKDCAIPFGRVIDEAPTLAKILGQTLPQADGVSMDELLTEAITMGR